MYATVIIMKISNLENMGFNKVQLDYVYKNVKSINKIETFDGDNNEDSFCVDSLKYENLDSSNRRK